MRRKGIFVVIAIALALIVFCILFLTGVIKINLKSSSKGDLDISKGIAYFKYMNSYMVVSSDDVVLGSLDSEPKGLAEIAGITYKSIVVGEKIVPNEKKEYKYAIKLVDNFKKSSMSANKVYISSDKSASVYVGKVKILFGKDNDTEEKIRDLRDFYADLADLDGTLDMSNLSENNAGYTFKKN